MFLQYQQSDQQSNRENASNCHTNLQILHMQMPTVTVLVQKRLNIPSAQWQARTEEF
jgi:hypothetical protein